MIIALLLTAVQTPATPPAKPICQNTQPKTAQGSSNTRTRVGPLNRQPNAKQILAVLRTEDGCTRPVVIRENVGVR